MPEFLEGKNPVWEALKAGRPVHRIYLAGEKDRKTGEIIGMARERKILVDFVSPDRIRRMARTAAHQNVLAVVGEKEFASLDGILNYAAALGEAPFLILLDQVVDPHNLGSLIRTGEAAGVHGMVIPQRRSAGLTATVAKVASGALEHVPVARTVNLSRTMQELKEKGVWLVGAEAEGRTACYDVDLTVPVALVLGSEGRGLRPLIKRDCDWLVRIPMYGRINSLNVAVAGAILIYETVRQRKGKRGDKTADFGKKPAF
ncbi:MAG: 23S rRNA (guanosine(2251)-2'-O)-methyltransferase RlmB [Bacillota bacterium]